MRETNKNDHTDIGVQRPLIHFINQKDKFPILKI